MASLTAADTDHSTSFTLYTCLTGAAPAVQTNLTMSSGKHAGGRPTLARCSLVMRGTPLSQMMRGRQTRPPSVAMLTLSPWAWMLTNSPIMADRRSWRTFLTKASGRRTTPSTRPFRKTSAVPLCNHTGGSFSETNLALTAAKRASCTHTRL